MPKASRAFVSLLLGAALTACASPAATPAPAPVQAPVESQTPAPSVPASATACTPGASAADLPSSRFGGITLPPVPDAATAEQPWFGYLSATQLTPDGIAPNVYIRSGGMATVDAGEFTLQGSVMPAPAATWFDTHLQITGVHPSQQQHWTNFEGGFQLRIPAGQPGDSFRVTLKDVLRPDGSHGDLSVEFCRQNPPEVTVAQQAEDGSRVRLTFSRPMIRATVEEALRGPHDKEGNSQGAWITGLTWLDDRTVELTAAQPQPVMRLNLAGAQDSFGLFIPQSPPHIYTGAPPQAVAVDVATGQEKALAALMPEPNGGTISPDGRWLRVTSMEFRGANGMPDWKHQLIDLTTGKAESVKPEALYGTWTTSGELIEVRNAMSDLMVTRRSVTGEPQHTRLPGVANYDSVIASPDGNWLALLVRTDHRVDDYEEAAFLLLSTDGTTRKELTGKVALWRPGKDGLMLYGPAWSPDSTRLALTTQQDGRPALVIADPTAGALRTLTADLPGLRMAEIDPITWSPDSTRILVGPLLIDAATGEVVQRIEGITGRPHWSPDGQTLLFQSSAWEPITAYHLPTGKVTDLGVGILLGWRPDGQALLIRWAGAAYRTPWWTI
jgi:hypothetical protein